MNRALRISILANLLLATLAGWLAHRWQSSNTRSRAISGPASSPAAAQASSAPTAPPQLPSAVRPEFRWSQIESTDYATYIANLRRVGCPEQTIRDIITADVRSLYALQAERLESNRVAQAQGPTARSTSARNLSSQSAESGLHDSASEADSVVSSLLGPQPSAGSGQAVYIPGPAGPGVSTPARVQRSTGADPALSLPLVYQTVDPATLPLSDTQLGVFDSLRQVFQDDIGGPNQDPNDPAYAQRWEIARRKSDDTLRGLLGDSFFGNYQWQAANQASQRK